jgi:hypothetical protein
MTCVATLHSAHQQSALTILCLMPLSIATASSVIIQFDIILSVMAQKSRYEITHKVPEINFPII